MITTLERPATSMRFEVHGNARKAILYRYAGGRATFSPGFTVFTRFTYDDLDQGYQRVLRQLMRIQRK